MRIPEIDRVFSRTHGIFPLSLAFGPLDEMMGYCEQSYATFAGSVGRTMLCKATRFRNRCSPTADRQLSL